ncbi:hypothetical protein BDN71DRAFT_1436594 [Pleurotus eryngii]|uniref:SHSP domain-containing protein n=1 Tax=Pleurotus eryngii TaxID=5323 RepID=A0A9P5ZGS6_PLEER|nr:hypothetical protein BDN71DRAFT_1436594 [Pleurotus eryngii]
MFHTFFHEQRKGEKQSGRQSGFRPYICTPGARCSGNANLGFRPSVPSSTETMDDAERLMSEEVTDAEGVRLRQPRVRHYERKDFAFAEIDLPGIWAGDITLSLQDNRLTLFALNDLRHIAYEWETYIFPMITACNFQCGMKHSVLGISWLNWGSGEDTSPQQIQSLEIGMHNFTPSTHLDHVFCNSTLYKPVHKLTIYKDVYVGLS